MANTRPERGDRSAAPMRRRPNRRRRKVCAFCVDKEHKFIDFKAVNRLFLHYTLTVGKVLL